MSDTITTVAARAEDLRKVYGEGDAAVEALRGITVEFGSGRFTAIMGASGSGKSTLLHCMAGLDTPTSGHVFIGDVDITTLSEKHLTQLRRDKVGFVFQAFNLIPTLTAKENVTLPLDIAGPRRRRGMVRLGRRHGRAASTAWTTVPPSSPAASSSASPPRARSCRDRRSCSRTSPRATSTRRPALSCSRSCAAPSTTTGSRS